MARAPSVSWPGGVAGNANLPSVGAAVDRQQFETSATRAALNVGVEHQLHVLVVDAGRHHHGAF